MVIGQRIQIADPAVIWGERFAFLIHQTAEFLNAELFNQELQTGAVAVFLLTQTGEDTRNRLGNRQDFFLGHELM